jgi:hypothetical protein
VAAGGIEVAVPPLTGTEVTGPVAVVAPSTVPLEPWAWLAGWPELVLKDSLLTPINLAGRCRLAEGA